MAWYLRKQHPVDEDGPPSEYRRAELQHGEGPPFVVLEVMKHGKAEWMMGADTNDEMQALWVKYFAR